MNRYTKRRRRRAGRLVTGVAVGAVAFGTVGVLPASAATAAAVNGTSAMFSGGVLVVVGDPQSNTIVISRNAAGAILVNGGTLPVRGGTPTVATTRSILVGAGAGDDNVTIDEANGPMPRATLVGAAGNDTLIGGSGADVLAGGTGNDTLLGKGGADMLFGGSDDDTLTGGAGDDQAFGESGTDRLIWNPGDATDLNEGGDGVDTVEVNGGNGAEQFVETANGTRVRFDRVNPAPFSLDIGTTENLVLNANGGDDSFTATGNLAPLVTTTVDGGAGNDTISGTNGADRLLGGAGNDFVDGQAGNDTLLGGDGDDVLIGGLGNDVLDGGAGNNVLIQDEALANGAATEHS